MFQRYVGKVIHTYFVILYTYVRGAIQTKFNTLFKLYDDSILKAILLNIFILKCHSGIGYNILFSSYN